MEKSIYLEARQLKSINNSDDNLQFIDKKEDSVLEAISEGEELEEFGFRYTFLQRKSLLMITLIVAAVVVVQVLHK